MSGRASNDAEADVSLRARFRARSSESSGGA